MVNYLRLVRRFFIIRKKEVKSMKQFIAKIKDKLATVDKGTIIRSTTLVLAMANQVIAIIGASTFANSVWYQIASVVVTMISSLVSAWENNDWTYYAKLGTGVLDALEDGKITVEEVQELLDKHKVEEKTE